jgi:hypothetical protein
MLLRLPTVIGTAGVILPTGIATDDGNKSFFRDIVERRRLISLNSFENERNIFSGVHHAFKFALITIGQCRNDAKFLTNPLIFIRL